MHFPPFRPLFISKLPYTPTESQFQTIDLLLQFLDSPAPNSIFLLKGYAGTGKSSFFAAFVSACTDLNIKTVLLAPTGRAAKVFSGYTGMSAFTIHKKIYRQKRVGGGGTMFDLSDNLHTNTLFIVDEASMISNQSDQGFGTNGVLDDLIHYVYNGDNCRLILIGDQAQLPPVGELIGKALDNNYLAGYGFDIFDATLTDVVRQEAESGILFNATLVRSLIGNNQPFVMPTLVKGEFPDIYFVSSVELSDHLEQCYGRDGIENSIIITRSNKRALQYNMAVRNQILYREELLTTGDLLIVTKNNYYWNIPYEGLPFIANGEMLEISRMKGVEEIYDQRFYNLSVRIISTDMEIDARILESALLDEQSPISKDKQEQFLNSVLEDYTHINNKSTLYKELKNNSYLNSIYAKFGYAITCHKSQGGQWTNVFVDMGTLIVDNLDESFYKWLYTAITRATERLYFINYQKEEEF